MNMFIMEFFQQQKRLFPGSTNRENKFVFLVVYKKMIVSDAIAKFRISYSPKPSVPRTLIHPLRVVIDSKI